MPDDTAFEGLPAIVQDDEDAALYLALLELSKGGKDNTAQRFKNERLQGLVAGDKALAQSDPDLVNPDDARRRRQDLDSLR